MNRKGRNNLPVHAGIPNHIRKFYGREYELRKHLENTDWHTHWPKLNEALEHHQVAKKINGLFKILLQQQRKANQGKDELIGWDDPKQFINPKTFTNLINQGLKEERTDNQKLLQRIAAQFTLISLNGCGEAYCQALENNFAGADYSSLGYLGMINNKLFKNNAILEKHLQLTPDLSLIRPVAKEIFEFWLDYQMELVTNSQNTKYVRKLQQKDLLSVQNILEAEMERAPKAAGADQRLLLDCTDKLDQFGHFMLEHWPVLESHGDFIRSSQQAKFFAAYYSGSLSQEFKKISALESK